MQVLQGEVTIIHGVARRSSPEEMAQFLDRPPRVLQCWSMQGKASERMLLISEGMGSHTEVVDWEAMTNWLRENHPDAVAEHEGETVLLLADMDSRVLTACLAHARAKRRERMGGGLRGFRLGHLVGEVGNLFAYKGCTLPRTAVTG